MGRIFFFLLTRYLELGMHFEALQLSGIFKGQNIVCYADAEIIIIFFLISKMVMVTLLTNLLNQKSLCVKI